MDSWKYLPDGRAVCLNEEFDFQFENPGCRSKLMGCELKPMSSNGETNYPLVSNTQALERLDFMDNMGFDEIRKSLSISSEPSGEVFSDEVGDDYGNVASPFGEDKDSDSRNNFLLTDFMQSSAQDLAFVDLKLGRLATDGGVAKDGDFSDACVAGSSAMPSSPAKRSRSASMFMPSATCQVLGCNKDLSSHKGYYKRLKVCDEHTRTPKVTVKGLEQRFCQQCSRFHQLAEFDDGKRSCRRRLAAHNKRRRKPRFSSESGTEIIDFSSSHSLSEGHPTTTTASSSNFDAWRWPDNVKVEDSFESSDNLFGLGERMKGSIVSTTTASILNSSTVEQTSRALSLLSAQSHMSTNTPITTSIFNDNHHAHRINHSPRGYSHHVAQGSSFHAPGAMYTSDHNTNSNAIVDLRQLSSHLQRIEQQRHPSTES